MANAVVSPAWFMVAVRALIGLAQSEHVCPSAALAGQVKTHAVFLRRVLAELVRARLVEAKEGRDGGYRLARPPEAITLAEVYRAVRATRAGAFEGEPTCPESVGFRRAFDEIVDETEAQVVRVLEGYTIGGLMARADALQEGGNPALPPDLPCRLALLR